MATLSLRTFCQSKYARRCKYVYKEKTHRGTDSESETMFHERIGHTTQSRMLSLIKDLTTRCGRQKIILNSENSNNTTENNTKGNSVLNYIGRNECLNMAEKVPVDDKKAVRRKKIIATLLYLGSVSTLEYGVGNGCCGSHVDFVAACRHGSLT